MMRTAAARSEGSSSSAKSIPLRRVSENETANEMRDLSGRFHSSFSRHFEGRRAASYLAFAVLRFLASICLAVAVPMSQSVDASFKPCADALAVALLSSATGLQAATGIMSSGLSIFSGIRQQCATDLRWFRADLAVCRLSTMFAFWCTGICVAYVLHGTECDNSPTGKFAALLALSTTQSLLSLPYLLTSLSKALKFSALYAPFTATFGGVFFSIMLQNAMIAPELRGWPGWGNLDHSIAKEFQRYFGARSTFAAGAMICEAVPMIFHFVFIWRRDRILHLWGILWIFTCGALLMIPLCGVSWLSIQREVLCNLPEWRPDFFPSEDTKVFSQVVCGTSNGFFGVITALGFIAALVAFAHSAMTNLFERFLFCEWIAHRPARIPRDLLAAPKSSRTAGTGGTLTATEGGSSSLANPTVAETTASKGKSNSESWTLDLGNTDSS